MKHIRKYFALVILGLLTACETPMVQSISPDQLIRSDLMSFIHDGVTTRQEVLLKLGAPSAQFEQQRILTYQIRVDKDGTAHLIWPRRSHEHPVFTYWNAGMYSIVLVFGSDGVLEKHSLVGAQ